MTDKKTTRTEFDTMGEVKVPADRYWGAQTERSLDHFKIGGERFPREMIRAFGILKKAARSPTPSSASCRREGDHHPACDEILEGELDDHFPLVVWQTGSGTQTNMNVNEVIANRAIEMLGGELGSKKPIHPERRRQPEPVLQRHLSHGHAHRRHRRDPVAADPGGADAARDARPEGEGVRGHRQDRTDASPGRRPAHAGPGVFRMGFAARPRPRAHRGGNAPPAGTRPRRNGRRHGTQRARGLRARVAKEIAKITGIGFVTAPNKFEALAAHDAIVNAHGAIRTSRWRS